MIKEVIGVFMIFTENSDQAAILLRKAVPKMIKHKIVPNPFNFTLWYAYYSKQFPGLNDELDFLVNKVGTCPANESEKLFLKHIIKNDEEFESVKEMFHQGITNIVDGLSESIDATVKEGGDLSSALLANIGSLAVLEKDKKSAKLIAQLSDNAGALCELSDSFQGKISDAQQEIKSLKEQLKEKEKQANTDALTGLNNRRVFEQMYFKLIETDPYMEISLIMIDIDKFKLFNDNHGHLMGDQVLRLVGSLMKAECPEPLVPVRYGGEEFALLCPGLDADEACDVAERLRAKLCSVSLSNKRTGKKIPPVTASFGVSYARGDELNQLIERADTALYMAKEKGRNTVQVYL